MGIAPTRYATVIDPSVRIPEGCRIGRGSILLQNVTLTASVTLGSHVVAMPWGHVHARRRSWRTSRPSPPEPRSAAVCG